eukprot:357424-Chlamydomonas_euryale.AAC.1
MPVLGFLLRPACPRARRGAGRAPAAVMAGGVGQRCGTTERDWRVRMDAHGRGVKLDKSKYMQEGCSGQDSSLLAMRCVRSGNMALSGESIPGCNIHG